MKTPLRFLLGAGLTAGTVFFLWATGIEPTPTNWLTCLGVAAILILAVGFVNWRNFRNQVKRSRRPSGATGDRFQRDQVIISTRNTDENLYTPPQSLRQ